MSAPEFAHSRFGIEICSLETGKRIYALNENQFFVPGSTTKLLTEGTALGLLGKDYRFHTLVYRTGDVGQDGTLHGDIVLVAAGDPNLSGRIQADETLAFEDEDHSYGGPDSKGLPGELQQYEAVGQTVMVTGTIALGKPPAMYSCKIPERGRFASLAFVESLAKRKIAVAPVDLPAAANLKSPQPPTTSTEAGCFALYADFAD